MQHVIRLWAFNSFLKITSECAHHLESIKKIYDNVHQFIRVNEIELALMNTRPFQRLRHIHQLGFAYFVYPGGTHRRFEHSLGVMEIATRIYDEVTTKRPFSYLSHPGHELLDEYIPKAKSQMHGYWRQILRLAALAHDLGHLPFSHTAEKVLLGTLGHEQWTSIIIDSVYLAPIWEVIQVDYPDQNVKEDVLKISIGEQKFLKIADNPRSFTPWEQVLTAMITGDFFGADRIDYLLRDSKCTGLTYGLFDYHQLIETLIIMPACTARVSLELGIQENGIESCETLLLARHYMQKRLYQYASVQSYSFHLSRFMAIIYSDLDRKLDNYIAMTDNEVLATLNRAFLNPKHPAHFDATCLYLEEKRFRAIPFHLPLQEKEIECMRDELNIPVDQIAWYFAEKREGKQGLNFPVLKKEGVIDRGSNLSSVSIPLHQQSWIYVAPHYEMAFRKRFMEKSKSEVH